MRAICLAAAGLTCAALPPAAEAAPPRTVTVIVDKMAFGAVPPDLSVGDTVVWKNRDLFRHTATSAGHFDIDLPPGSERRMVLRSDGAFTFSCKFHPGMKGVMKVKK